VLFSQSPAAIASTPSFPILLTFVKVEYIYIFKKRKEKIEKGGVNRDNNILISANIKFHQPTIHAQRGT
jgi:hypothetical protein